MSEDHLNRLPPALPPPSSSTDTVDLPTLPPADPAATATLSPWPEGATSSLAPLASSTGPSRYRIVRPFARGGLGEVFLAHDDELDREVALKEIQAPFADDVESRARFVREGMVTGGLEHPGIVPVYGLGAYVDGRPYYAMRFIKGESFQDAISRFHQDDVPGRDPGERALALRQLLRRFIDVCNAIAYAHSRGVLHRDLKPANVMLGAYGETLVVDWGLAKAFGQHDGDAVSEGARPIALAGSGEVVTQMGAVIGTPAYMSPEQAAGKHEELGPAADVYSLGAMLYCLLTGKVPIEEPDLLLTLVRVQTGEFPPPRQVKRNVPVALEAICLKAMTLQPENRYGSARELADDLEHWLADEPVAAHRESIWERTRRLCRHRPVYAAVMGFLAAMDLAICAVCIAFYMGMAALAFLPYMLVTGVIGGGLGVLLLAQVWWLLGAVAGALLASRAARSGGLIGLVLGGLMAWVFIAMPWVSAPSGRAAAPSFGVVVVPFAGAAVGLLLGAFISTRWTRAKKRSLLMGLALTIIWALTSRWTRAKKKMLLIALLGSALGYIAGSVVAAAMALAIGAASLEPALSGTIIGALVGASLGTIIGTFPGNAKRAAVGTSLGALLGTLLGVVLSIFATEGEFFFTGWDVIFMRLLTSILAGGLPGATMGALVVSCRGEARKRMVWSGFLGGRIGIAAGTLLFALLMLIAMQIGPTASALTWFALPVLLAPAVLDVGRGLMSRARWDNLLTRATRGVLFGAVLGGSTAVTLWMATSFSRFSNPSGTQSAGSGAVLPAGPPTEPGGFGQVPQQIAPGRLRKGANPPKAGGFGQVPQAGAGPEAADPFQALITMQEQLFRNQPGNIELAVSLGSLRSVQARMTRDGGNLEKALLQYDKAIATLQATIEKEPRHSQAREALRDSHAGRAETLVRLNRPGEALTEWHRALGLDTWPRRNEFRLQLALALARMGEHVGATKECDALAEGKNLSAATLYTLAQVYARSAGALQADPPMGPPLPPAEQQKLRKRYADRAVAVLVEAEAAGYFQAPGKLDELKTSTDFESLRAREDFKSLLARLARPGAQRKVP